MPEMGKRSLKKSEGNLKINFKIIYIKKKLKMVVVTSTSALFKKALVTLILQRQPKLQSECNRAAKPLMIPGSNLMLKSVLHSTEVLKYSPF